MRLSKLILSGFKSFAKTTTFEFPAATSAIVGPNGSGKSNVAEAIRWVLGEQSLKTLRGKKGEDLIFNGSASSPRMGKAAVVMTFDNRDHAIPIDFGEVSLERKAFRDGANEYFLNGSQVRLKDIVELIAKMGLGETKHNIIGQGEVDHILAAPPRERREILEETIGLRIYQLRKREAERKLEETAENMSQVEALLKEIKPHLKFLKTQAERAEKRELVEKELEDYYRAYIFKEEKDIVAEAETLERETSPSRARLAILEKEAAELKKKAEEAEGREEDSYLRNQQSKLAELENQRREMARELGRIEGLLEAESASRAPARKKRLIDASLVRENLSLIMGAIKDILGLDDLALIKSRVEAAAKRIESFLAELEEPAKETGERREKEAAPEGSLDSRKESRERELADLDERLSAIRRDITAKMDALKAEQAGLRAAWQNLREREEEASSIRSALQRLDFEKEKLALRRGELRRVAEESGLVKEELASRESPFSGLEREELRKKIEKLRIRLEEIGGIDSMVLKEYRDTETRYEFLERELGDLAKAGRDLRQLAAELEERIESEFKRGFAKIKEEFHNYFRIIFGGGKGEMSYVPLRQKPPGSEENMTGGDSGEAEYGIEIDVDIPRKRIKGLAMLSGGERALVSIAILFAITAVNPPPFLVLDETDAALDEANSQKYGAILRELSKKTQLVLITHNRETMKQAAILYGVTMGEDGISKILSLKLEEAESYGSR